MIVKGTKQLGNFKRGINIYVPKRIVAPPAPSGFPNVASTNQIALTNVTGTMFGVANNGIGTYTKNGIWNGTGGGGIAYAFDTDGNSVITFVGGIGGNWFLYGYNGDNSEPYSINLSDDPTTIPTTGWSPSITITAA